MGQQLSQFKQVAKEVLSEQLTAEQNLKEARWKAMSLSGKISNISAENSKYKGPGVGCACCTLGTLKGPL